MKRVLEVKVVILLLLTACALGNIRRVPSEYPTIQAAIDSCNNGDTVLVAPGTYTGDGNCDIEFKGKAITVKSENGPESCIIDCNGTEQDPHRGFYFHNNEDANSVLQGFTIINGYAFEGAGIFCHTASPLIRDCLISANTAFVGNQSDGGGGGGIKCIYSNLTITSCIVCNNSADYGGGVSSGGHFGTLATLTMINCYILGNKSERSSGGIYCNGDITLLNCTIFGNRAGSEGGGIYINGPLRINNSIIYGNIALTGHEVDHGPYGAAGCRPESNKVTYSVVGGDSNAIDIPRCYSGEWLHTDPLFARPGYWDPNGTLDDTNDDFWVDGDYHLKSQAGRWDPNNQSWVIDDVTSPCIDAGDPNTPIGNEPFPNGGIINMGAYGGTAEASKSDFNEPLSALAYPGPDGRLVYVPYANCGDTRELNVLPDWSQCGYMGGGVKIPNIPSKIAITPLEGDNTSAIQAAIDYMSQRRSDPNGFRGAVLLKSGTYHVEGTLHINQSGIILRGEGTSDRGTIIVDTGQDQDTLIEVTGGSRTEFTNTRTDIIDSFVPVGARSFEVASANGFYVDDKIIVHRQTNDAWIDELDMAQYGWTADYYQDKWERVITAIEDGRITVDVPIVQAIEQRYGGSSIYKYSTDERINNVGIENLCLESEYMHNTDENHGWNAITLSDVENAWVLQVTSRYFGYSCVSANRGAKNITIEDCACLDPKSQITGSRRYSFNMDDCCFVLVQRCFTREGRHDYITGSRVPGPNAFVDCLAINCYADSGNHHRYAEGTLFDNVKAENLAVENRESSGSGHGWSGAQTMFWNCEAETICHTPVGAMNWAIGIVGEQAFGHWAPQEPLGYWESFGAHVFPRSLYYSQLEDRLGPEAVMNVTIPAQRTGTIWSLLADWAGEGRAEGVPIINTDDPL
jgi:hypothetical protein